MTLMGQINAYTILIVKPEWKRRISHGWWKDNIKMYLNKTVKCGLDSSG
jgi:hypothetical protein